MSRAIHRILCCVGLKADCKPVLEQALELALATGADLHVLHAIKSLSDDVLNTLRVSIPDQDVVENLRTRRLEQAQQALDDWITAFWSTHPELLDEFASTDIERSVMEGYPASVITKFAERSRSDIIVLAANKRSLTATYAGKVTKGVIKRAKVPVVVVPPRHG